MAEQRRTFSPALLFNSVTMAMLALALVVCCLTVVMAATWPRNGRAPVEPTATLVGLSTATPTPLAPTQEAAEPAAENPGAAQIAVAGVTESAAPKAPEVPTITPTQSVGRASTSTPTPTHTATATLPTATASATTTVTPTVTLTATPTSYPFVLRGNQVTYSANPNHNGACQWTGMVGGVFDRTGQPLVGYRIHVFGPGVDTRVLSGAFPEWGISGWEAPIGTIPPKLAYFVQLEGPTGEILSASITVTFIGDCSRNLALLNFDEAQ